jgi:hypothetical protein
LIKRNAEIRSKISFQKWATFTNLFGLFTMIGALIAEFSLRVQPKWLLVYIALGIVIFSSVNIFILNKQNSLQTQKI